VLASLSPSQKLLANYSPTPLSQPGTPGSHTKPAAADIQQAVAPDTHSVGKTTEEKTTPTVQMANVALPGTDSTLQLATAMYLAEARSTAAEELVGEDSTACPRHTPAVQEIVPFGR